MRKNSKGILTWPEGDRPRERLLRGGDFQRKTNQLVREKVGTLGVQPVEDFVEIDSETIELIKKKKGGNNTKVINLIKSIEKAAEEESADPFLITMAERAKGVLESFENRQLSTAQALEELFQEIRKNEQRKREQQEKGLDGLTYFVYRTLLDAGIREAEQVSKRIKEVFLEYPHWLTSEKELRELRQGITFAIFRVEDNIEKISVIVEDLLRLLERAKGI